MSEGEEFVQLEQIEDSLAVLSKPQRRRALCLAEARTALLGMHPTIYTGSERGSSATLTAQGVRADPNELIDLAAYIETGLPADLSVVEESGQDIGSQV